MSTSRNLESLLGVLEEKIARVMLLSFSMYILFVEFNQIESTFYIAFLNFVVLARGTERKYSKSDTHVFFIVQTFCGFKSEWINISYRLSGLWGPR